ncbi:hypothetical protein [Sphingobium lignivorans]|uniref:AAA+ ATPase domain-containing protein n=1 Tax=Sphingobium lignivorans TaxID=2735886 RepID=A0ABR6NH17_9SPHN|nr:hypothetical protein [Sphingobium lignivorans]MBB5986575.1 hypothetical protein [Sphingobium lignivorans]
MADTILIDPELWASTRAGARAGRGFRYQDVATALLAVQSWSGAEWTSVIPEGVDDATLHGPARELRVQAKSRHDPRGMFSTVEVAAHIAKSVADVSAQDLLAGRVGLVLLLERPVDGIEATGLDATLGDDSGAAAALSEHLTEVANALGISATDIMAATHLLVVPEPADAIVDLVVSRADCVPAAGRLVADRLRQRVGALADANYRAAAASPALLNSNDVQAVVDDVLALVDRDSVLSAISIGLCEPVSFAPLESPGFFDGVDVVPGHVGAGLVLDRPEVIAEVSRALQRRRSALVAGPSGSGKSACAWLAAHDSRHAVRWYRVRRAPPDQAHLLLDLAKAIEASADRPVGFVFDDLGRDLAGGWDAFQRAADGQPGILMLGTVREEDLYLINDLAGTPLVRPTLDEGLAQRIWTALRAERDLAFVSWREPYERSLGLMLEYVHLLTSGNRLQDTLDAQVRRRVREARDAELNVLAAVVEGARLGGSIDAKLLRDRLGLSAGDFDRALMRLVDEHAIRVVGDGTLTGLHEIRSAGLHDALARMTTRSRGDALDDLIAMLSPRSFAVVLPRLLADGGFTDGALLDAVATRAPSLSAPDIASLAYGLGLANCDRVAERWLVIAGEEGLEPKQASLPLSLAIAETTIDVPPFAKINAAINRRNELVMPDLRAGLLDRTGGLRWLNPGLTDYHDLAASFAPIPFLDPEPPFELLPDLGTSDPTLDEILDLLSTTRTFGGGRAERVVDLFGGTEALLERIHMEKSWIMRPVLRNEPEGLAVVSDVRYVDPVVQGEPNDVVVTHCGHLIAAAPFADLAVSTLVGWDGRPAGLANFPVAAKRIPRESLPSPVSVAWNRAILRAVQRRHASATESGRANALSVAIAELGDLLSDAAELHCRGAAAGKPAELMVAVRTLLNSFIEAGGTDLGGQSARDPGAADMNDELHSFVTSVTDLVRELGAGDIERPLIKAADVARLRATARTIRSAPDWRWLEEPPHEALDRLAGIFDDLDAVLGLAHGDRNAWRQLRLHAERSSRKNRTLPRFAADARRITEASSERVALAIRDALSADGRTARVVRRPADPDALAWPRVEYLALVTVDSLATFMAEVDILTATCRAAASGHPIYIAPVREGMVVAMLAGLAASVDESSIGSVFPSGFVTDTSFDRWIPHLPLPLLQERSSAAFHEVTATAVQLSSVMANADRPPNEKEMVYAQGLVDRMRARAAELGALRDAEPDEDLMLASEYVINLLQRLQRELDGVEDGETIAAETARLAFGEATEASLRGPIIRIGLVERDILASAQTNLSGEAP